MTYPEDVRLAAKAEIAKGEMAFLTVANAILAERKRCAAVARAIGEAYRRHDADPTRSAVADTIAKGIEI